ncbi:MAG: LysR family transcriptional regulator [Paracoccaceae bacterium]
MSRRLTALERRLGETLFRRGAQGYALTARGGRCASRRSRCGHSRIGSRPRRGGQGGAGPGADHRRALDQPFPRLPSRPGLVARRALGAGTARLYGQSRHRPARRRHRHPQPPPGAELARRPAHGAHRLCRIRRQPRSGGLSCGDRRHPLHPVRALARRASWRRRDRHPRLQRDGCCSTSPAPGSGGWCCRPTPATGPPASCGCRRPIEELSHDEWLVAHHEARHDPPVRAALDAVAQLLTDTSLRPPLA